MSYFIQLKKDREQHDKYHSTSINGPQISRRMLSSLRVVSSSLDHSKVGIYNVGMAEGNSTALRTLIGLLKKLPPSSASFGTCGFINETCTELQIFVCIDTSESNLTGFIAAGIVPRNSPVAKYPSTPGFAPSEPAVLMGVEHIWVAPSMRRRRIASSLVDTARVSLVSGVSFSKTQVSFRFPNEHYAAFACKYTDAVNFWTHCPASGNR